MSLFLSLIMYKFLTCILLFISFFSCSEKEVKPNCNPENPFEMDWIQEWISELQLCACTISIFQAEYKNETIFWQLISDPLCQSTISNVHVVNCLGDEILILADYQDWIEFNKNVKNRKIIYACPTNRN